MSLNPHVLEVWEYFWSLMIVIRKSLSKAGWGSCPKHVAGVKRYAKQDFGEVEVSAPEVDPK